LEVEYHESENSSRIQVPQTGTQSEPISSGRCEDLYGVGILTTQTVLLTKNRNSYDEVYFKEFFDGLVADSDTLFAALVSQPERLGEVRRRAISRTPLPILLRGLLGEGEAGKLSLHLWPTHQ
jgi:hypothetical protein